MLPRNPVAENVQFLVENARIEASLKAYHLIAAEVAHMAVIKTCRDLINGRPETTCSGWHIRNGQTVAALYRA